MDVITQYLGWAAWILLLIPLVLVVRLLVRRSRWSILRMTLVSLTGVAVVTLWLHYAEALAGAEPNSYAGAFGTYLASVLEGCVGGTPLSFFISTALLFLWAGFALMDAVVNTARFYINKPYIKEIKKEVIVEKIKWIEKEKPVERKPKSTPTKPQAIPMRIASRVHLKIGLM